MPFCKKQKNINAVEKHTTKTKHINAVL